MALSMYKIHVFDEAFFLLPTVPMMTEMRLFLVSIATNVNETNSFNTIMKLINPNNHWRWTQTEEGYSKILLLDESSTSLLTTQTTTMVSKCHIPQWKWVGENLFSLNPLDGQFGHFVIRTIRAIFKELFTVVFY